MLKKQKRLFLLATGGLVVLVLTFIGFYAYAPWLHTTAQNTDKKIPTLYPTTQGLYESCSPYDGASCLHHLQTIAKAGFRLVVNYDQLYGTEAQELAYAKEAHARGLQIIWDLSLPNFWNGKDLRAEYNNLAATCNCSDNAGFTRYVVNLVKILPTTWGYYIGDEVSGANHAAFKAFSDLVKQLDPAHPRLFIAGENTSTMGANVKPFVDSADVIGGDIYPISTADPLSSVGDISHAIQSVADHAGKRSAIVLQAFNWGEYPKDTWVCPSFPACAHFPTRSEMQLMRDFVMQRSHPQFILWYSFFDINRSDNPAGHLKDLIDAASRPVNAASH